MNRYGTSYLGNNRCMFSVWAPQKERMVLHIISPVEEKIELRKDRYGYFSIEAENIPPGAKYFFMPEGIKDFPDPVSHYQPEGVHGPSEVIDHESFSWSDIHWHGLPFRDLILYELHVGTFTREGTFEAVVPLLDELKETGINAIQLMPVAQFPGNRNWGYDGVLPYAIQNSYGGPIGLKKLVDACHRNGIAVFLDVVYNHVGPEGNYLSQYGPYFTEKYCTPWGDAINYDDEYADGVRKFFSDNALYWFELYHIDGLRLDAIHTVFDFSALHFWELLQSKIKLLEQQLGRSFYVIAESDLNSPRVVKPPETGGYGFTAQWLDDFHHALYVLLDKKGKNRYIDFGLFEQLSKAYTDGFVHSGEYVKFRRRRHGASSVGISGDKFVAFNQNHDQIGNRVRGERLSVLVDFERLKVAAAALMLSPYVPMLFMGEEYAEEAPFYYFVSHSDKALIEAVREGRKQEFAAFKSEGEPPDAQDEKTFTDSKLQWHKRNQGKHFLMLHWYKELIKLRKESPVLRNFKKDDVKVYILNQAGFIVHRKSESGNEHLLCMFNLAEYEIRCTVPYASAKWRKILDSKEKQWLEKPDNSGRIFPMVIRSGENMRLIPLSVAVYQSKIEIYNA